MNEGFEKIYERLNQMNQDTTARQLTCSARFSGIEQSIAIGRAINGIHDDSKKRSRDFQSYLVRTMLGTIILGMLVVIWKIFVGHIDLIVK